MKIFQDKIKDEKNVCRQILYSFLFAAAVGGFFSFLIMVLLLIWGTPSTPFFLSIPLFTAVFAGVCGIFGIIVDRILFRIGLINTGFTRILGYFCTLALACFIVFLVALISGYTKELWKFFSEFFWLILSGVFFGGIAAVIEYFYSQLGGKVKDLAVRNRLLADLAQKDRELAEKTKALAVLEERTKIARDLHDSISQGINGIFYSCHTLKHYLEQRNISEEGRRIVEHLEKTAGLTLSELRALILELRPALLETKGLSEALRVHADLFSWRYETGVELKLDYGAGLTSEQEMAVYRIVQEALANIRKHAQARKVLLSLVEKESQVELTIMDNGSGFDRKRVAGGYGLVNMENRARENAGVFRLETAPGQGTTIKVDLQKD